MSRTWRQLPKGLYHYSRNNIKGGAAYSKGPSYERCRPDTSYNIENLHIAIELLEQTAERLQCSVAFNETHDITHILLDTAIDIGYDPDSIIYSLGVCQKTINQISNNINYSYKIFIDASIFLQIIANTSSCDTRYRYKYIMVPDGQQQKSSIVFLRDDHVTGLREQDHRRARREVKYNAFDIDLLENTRIGKTRRYIDKYGRYRF